MPCRCAVPGCCGNFNSFKKVSVFAFPKDPGLRKTWLKAIKREDFVPKKSDKVCIKHFKPEDVKSQAFAYDRAKQQAKLVSLKKCCLKPNSVPSLFENNSFETGNKTVVRDAVLKENQERNKTKSTSMQKSPKGAASEFESNITNSPSKQQNQRSPFKTRRNSTTTDAPIIAVIEPEDVDNSVNMSQETISESEDDNDADDDDDCIIEDTKISSTTLLPAAFKDLPTVSVCLREEDRVPFVRELKGIKRSSSTGSNSSVGSSETPKASGSQKRRKIEKPAPVVIGRDNDCYCWVCHRENVHLSCIACPRAYHSKCSVPRATVNTPDWVCPECQRILAAENVDTRSSTLAEISLDKLATLLKLSLNKMKLRAPLAFHQPVSLSHYPLYLHYVIHPMDLSLLERNIKQKLYGCTEAFLADVKWLAHNSCVFNGAQHPLSTNAKNLVKSCDHDMQEIEVCPDCFIHSVVRNKYWFSEVCRKPHPLVWAKLKGFPYWPAKVVRIVDGNVDARFFGAHDRAWVPVSQCYHLSKEMPTTSKPKKKSNYEVALEELNVHVHLLVQKFKCFQYAPYRTAFNPQNTHLSYHGIDLNKAVEEEICIDISESPSSTVFPSPEKENRFAKYMDTEAEKDNSDDIIVISENQPEDSVTAGEKANSVESSKEIPAEDTKVESEKVKSDDFKSITETKSDAISDSDQLRKLELALERIKGYVSLDVDSEKEDTKSTEEKEEKEETNKDSPKKVISDSETKTKLSPFFKDLFTLPNIEKSVLPNLPATTEASENISVALETTKKTDSFFLKLNETIQSCKAKLGISEITDDLSDNESAIDENASKSEDDEETTSASEADEENSSMSEAENVEVSDDENGEAFDQEVENAETSNEEAEKNVNKNEDSSEAEESGGSDNESEAELSESSGTDVETGKAKVASKKGLADAHPDDKDNPVLISSDDNISSDKPSIQKASDELVEMKGSVNNVSSGKSPNVGIISAEDVNKSCNAALNSSPKNNVKIGESNADLVTQIKDDSISDAIKDLGATEQSVFTNSKLSKVHELSLTKLGFSEQQNKIESVATNAEPSTTKNVPNKVVNTEVEIAPLRRVCQNNADDSDDEIITCPLPRPKTPPVIVLDDDDLDETCAPDSSATNTHQQSSDSNFNNKLPPATQSQETAYSPKNRAMNGTLAKRSLLIEGTLQARNFGVDRRKRALDSDNSSSDDEIQEVAPMRKKLTGAIRTFNKSYNQTAPLATPKIEVENEEPEKENYSPQKSPVSYDGSKSDSDTREEIFSPTRNLLRNSILDTSHLGDKDKEILFLKNKLRCVLRAYHIQQWKCKQEREELRHNMNLVIMEMRTCMEADKKQAIELLSQKFEQEKFKIVEEAKHKQWCASCHIESRYACCWNTSYCSYNCQKRHFPEHRNVCTQIKNKNSDVAENKQATVLKPNDGSDKPKKLIIVNMKAHDNSKAPSESSTSVQSQQVASNKPQQIQVVSSKNSSQSGSSTPYIFITPMKTSAETSKSASVSPLNKTTTVVTTSNSTSFSSTTVSSEPTTSTLSTLTPNSISFVLTAPNATASNLTGQAFKPLLLPKPVPTPTEITPTASVSESPDSAIIFKGLKDKSCNLKTAITILKKKNLESSVSTGKVQSEEQANLEEIYFPSPPAVTFEGYESVSPEPNLVIDDAERTDDGSDEEDYEKITPEQDIILSDGEENDEMVNIGHSIEVKASFLNKCLVYGITATKLTRCLVDVIFQDIKLLATCSAFGRKSNVTKFTRCALPARKVYAIIDYVSKRFPYATRSEVVLAINRKCKEARKILSRTSNTEDKKEDSGDLTTMSKTLNSTPTIVVSAPKTQATSFVQTVIPKSMCPNLVSLKNPNSKQELRFTTSARKTILIQPKPVIKTLTRPGGSQTCSAMKASKFKRETVKELLSANMRQKSKRETFAEVLGKIKVTTSPTITTTTSSARPYIIIGSANNSVRQSAPVQQNQVVGTNISIIK